MALQPVVGDLMLFALGQQRSPQVRVQSRGFVGLFPPACAPALGPALLQAVDDIFAVAVQVDGAGLLELAQRLQQGCHLHAVVGRVRLPAGKLLLIHLLRRAEPQDRPPAARPGVAAAGTVRINFNLLHVLHSEFLSIIFYYTRFEIIWQGI